MNEKYWSLIEQILSISLHKRLHSQWGSQTKNFRELIRNDLQDFFEEQGWETDPSFKDLSVIPQHSSMALSISHCKPLGGYIVSSSAMDLGFDVEVIARCKEDNLLRVSEKEEVEVAPHPAALWVAKEAAFKSRWKGNQPPTLGEIVIEKWDPQESQVFAFECEGPGVVIMEGELAWAVHKWTQGN